MASLHIVIRADTPDTEARIERALRAGLPDSVIQRSTDAQTRGAQTPDALLDATASAARIDSSLRHELNNHLALIRMLADYLADHRQLPAAETAKIREIGVSAEAAAAALRRAAPAASETP